MKTKFLLPLVLFLSACASNPTGLAVPIQIPDLPSELNKRAEALPPIDAADMGSRELAGAESDRIYNDVAHRNNNLIDFYNCIKDSINNKTDLKICLK